MKIKTTPFAQRARSNQKRKTCPVLLAITSIPTQKIVNYAFQSLLQQPPSEPSQKVPNLGTNGLRSTSTTPRRVTKGGDTLTGAGVYRRDKKNIKSTVTHVIKSEDSKVYSVKYKV
ncbi:hypothetical protein TSUD_367680 [Trifolium subterraneum]|uniref:Uncharacterized protein n=1 Tax=Trifolium subterraneum TaxID=3900 RepID=A0A2Z6PNV0_TRISU|nr:hypothetical protein TSUD_367680 [Trifolium subterraneum]